MADFTNRLKELFNEGNTIPQITEKLNEEGFTNNNDKELSAWVIRSKAKALGLDTARARKTQTPKTRPSNTTSFENFSRFVLNSDWDNDKKIRVLRTYFNVET